MKSNLKREREKTILLQGEFLFVLFSFFSYLMGEEGFCLTTFDTALRYVEVMSSS